jgi:hydroxyacylglutathione hydrolase
MDINFLHLDFGDGVYAISAPSGEQMYLICGTHTAALIDTGMGIGSLKAYVRTLTDLPLIVINTHGHPDHAGGNGEFTDDPIYLSALDRDLYTTMCTVAFRQNDVRFMLGDEVDDILDQFVSTIPPTLPLNDNDHFDLGGRTLRAIAVPGHTPGCLCLYDDQTQCLFAGDVLTNGDTWLFLPHCLPLSTHLKSLLALQDLHLPIERIFPGHLPTPVAPDMIGRKIACAKAILADPSRGVPVKTFAGNGLRYELNGGSIIYNPVNIEA